VVVLHREEGEMSIKSHNLDDVDKSIIQMLVADGRRSFADIANELKLSASTVQQRANRLMDVGLLRIRAITDPVALGVPVTASILLKVDGARLREVAQEVAQFEEVGWVAITSGAYDISCEVACRDNDHLIELIADISSTDGIRSTETFMYLRIVKNNYQWGVP
jgi:Lrp/AsnC family transcriptional regulator, regulator for asnA, asnC and gidA